MEGDAGTRQLNPIGVQDSKDEGSEAESTSEEAPEASSEENTNATEAAEETNPSRLGRRWFAGICAALVLLTAGVAAGGFLALRFHQESAALTSADDAAVKAAMDCVGATQAPDTAAMSTSQGKIIECSTGDFGAQATLYSGVLVDAYRAANVTVQVTEMRAAIESHNPDGSVNVLVAMRTKVTNSEAADQEQGYRLRVQMAPADGTYKIADLKQVTT